MLFMFYKIEYPINYDNFLQIFKISKVDFLPNIGTWFFDSFDAESVEVGEKF